MGTLYSIEFPFLIFVICFQLFFSFITFLVAFLSLKIYKLTQQSQSRYLSIAFLLIFFSYAVQALFNILILLRINHELYVFFGIHPLSVFYNQGLYLHVFFMTIGITFLLYTTFKLKSRKLLLVLLFPSLLVLLLSKKLLLGFFMINSFYLFFVFHHSLLNYKSHKKAKPLIIALAFFFLWTGQVLFLFMGANPIIYFIAHLFNFVTYSLFLLNFLMILK
jgi:hypothetical protein